jgi:hypothetical protein
VRDTVVVSIVEQSSTRKFCLQKSTLHLSTTRASFRKNITRDEIFAQDDRLRSAKAQS